MNKNELVEEILDRSGLDFSRKKILDMINALVEVVGVELGKEKGKVKLVGFGSFKAEIQKKKKARNPRTGEEVIIPRRRVVKFLPGKKLKQELNK